MNKAPHSTAWRIATGIVAVLCAVFFIITSLSVGVSGSVSAYAAAETAAAFESQNVMDDLTGANIGGDGVDPSLYNFDEHKNVQILAFVEFCYSFYATKQSDYGLYVYVYNPRGYDFTQKPELNKIQFRYGGNSAAPYHKYFLRYINRSEKPGYEGLFYKFKIVLTPAQKNAILSALNSNERIYEVGGIELYDSGTNATEYAISNTFTYTGYAEGYGSASATENTLKCTSSNLMTLSLNVHPTVYRPEGNNGKNEYTQDSLHSVYFSIPNAILDKFGGLSAVHATWLNAVTAPIFVTGNEAVYNALLPYIGTTVPAYKTFRETCPYGFISDFAVYNASNVKFVEEINQLNYLFFVSGGGNASDSYTLPSDTISEWLLTYTAEHGGELVNGKYSRSLFNSVDADFTEVNIRADDKYSLTSEVIDKNFWEKLFGGSHIVSSTTFDDVEAIHPVTKNDFQSDVAQTCNELYISESDYLTFKAFYDQALLKRETVFLFRYQVSDYISSECANVQWGGTPLQPELYKHLDTNAYLAQETVNLDYDIIDVTCSMGDVETVIACVSSPQDIIPSVTPPLDTTDDTQPDWWKWIKMALGILAAILIFVILYPILSPFFGLIAKGIVWLIGAPFRLIGKLLNKKKKE